MKQKFYFLCLVLWSASHAIAQSKSPATLKADLDERRSAATARAQMAAAVAGKVESKEDALARLQTQKEFRIRKDDDEAQAAAAIDLGHRLNALQKPDDATAFYRAAEKSLEAAVRKTPDSEQQRKVLLLKNLAWMRSSYLGKPDEAEKALRQALALTPNDPRLQSAVQRYEEARALRRDGYPGKVGGKAP